MTTTIADMPGFELGSPVLVCRWRIWHGRLPLANRHLRALSLRTVEDKHVSKELVAWAKQHIEWTLDTGSVEHPNGVLMLILDEDGRAAMTVGPYTPLADATLASFARRARLAQQEGAKNGVAPESLWVADDGHFVWDLADEQVPSGIASLVEQLARTMGFAVERREGLLDQLRTGELETRDAFLASDEHGIVPCVEARGEHGLRMAQGYARLLERTR